MKEAERSENQLFLDITDKLKKFESNQKKVFIKTKPSSYYPRGKFYIGYIRFIEIDKLKVSLMEDKEGIVEIYFSDILSPNDILESRK